MGNAHNLRTKTTLKAIIYADPGNILHLFTHLHLNSTSIHTSIPIQIIQSTIHISIHQTKTANNPAQPIDPVNSQSTQHLIHPHNPKLLDQTKTRTLSTSPHTTLETSCPNKESQAQHSSTYPTTEMLFGQQMMPIRISALFSKDR